MSADPRPANCTMRLRQEQKAAPRSGCASCTNGGMFGCPYDGSRRPDSPPALPDAEVDRLEKQRQLGVWARKVAIEIICMSVDNASHMAALEVIEEAAKQKRAESDVGLNDLTAVGLGKLLGYLPLSTIRQRGGDVDKLIGMAKASGLHFHLMSQGECNVGSGALYIWDPVGLQRLLDLNLGVLVRWRWPTVADQVVECVASTMVAQETNPDLYELIGMMFGDARFKEPRHCRRPA